jgi:hypothetical protein
MRGRGRLGAEVHNFGGSFGGSTCRITLNFLLTIIACGHAYPSCHDIPSGIMPHDLLTCQFFFPTAWIWAAALQGRDPHQQ